MKDGEHPISHLGPKNLSRTGGPEHYLVYGRPNQIPNKWVKQITMLVGWHVSSGKPIPTIFLSLINLTTKKRSAQGSIMPPHQGRKGIK